MSANLTPMPPGWHPDPSGQPGQRYHDGQRWTEHFVPTPPTVHAAPAVAVAVTAGGGTNHALHAVLTLLSCGLWLPIWILTAIFSSASASSSVAIGSGGVTAKAGPTRFVPLMVFAALLAMGAIVEHPGLLIALLVLAGVGGAGFWVLKSAQQREEQLRKLQFERDMFARRAEAEDRLFQEGDDRGVYGQYPPPRSFHG